MGKHRHKKEGSYQDSQNESSGKKPGFLPVAVSLLVGIGGGFALGHFTMPKVVVSSSQAIRENTDAYQFVDPLLAVTRTDDSIPSPQYSGLYNSVQSLINGEIAAKTLDTASVYFANYGKSGSFTINPNVEYDPASMLKVVIMVGYLKESESDPSIMGRQLTFDSNIAKSIADIPFEDPTKLVIGNTYDVQTLIDKMIEDSDNGAMNLLLANIDDAYLTKIYTDLGLKGPETNAEYTISANDYSLFFRVLYNATYLNADDSEKALSILSKATYADGLVAGLPANTVVAHKFGEHVNGTGDTVSSVELHDCGIVYTTGGPYLLCVMTKGPSLATLQSTIAQISKLVYQSVSTK